MIVDVYTGYPEILVDLLVGSFGSTGEQQIFNVQQQRVDDLFVLRFSRGEPLLLLSLL
jgi:hypothetical protein